MYWDGQSRLKVKLSLLELLVTVEIK